MQRTGFGDDLAHRIAHARLIADVCGDTRDRSCSTNLLKPRSVPLDTVDARARFGEDTTSRESQAGPRTGDDDDLVPRIHSSVAPQDGDASDGFFDALQPAAVLRDRDPGALHLAHIGLAAKLCHELVDLAEAGSADRMSLGLEPARRVDRNASTDARVASLRKLA